MQRRVLGALTLNDLVGLLGTVVALAFLWGRGRHVWYWLDEGISIGIASHPLGEIPGLLRQDGAPPLYYGLLHGWMRLFGRSESSTHILSLVFALAAVPAGLWAGWSLFGRRAGWITALLVVISPFLGAYANEARMYTLVVLLCLVATATFLHAFVFRRRRRYLPAFAVCLTLLLYTHNWGLFFALATGLAVLALIALSPSGALRRQLLVDGALVFGAAGLLYLPWLPTLAYQVAHTGAPFTLRPTLLKVRSDVMDLVGGQTAVLALGLGSGMAFLAMLRRPWSKDSLAALVAGGIAAVVIGAGWAISRDNSVWVYRYLAVVLGPILLFLGAGLARSGRSATAALAVMVVLFAPVAVKGQAFDKSNVKQVATELGGRLKAGDLVVADFGRVPVLSTYLPAGLRYAETTGPVPDPWTSDQRDATRRLDEGHPAATLIPSLDALPVGGHVLVVCSAGTLADDATPFLRLIFERCNEARALAEGDDRFRLDGTVKAIAYLSNSPVDGFLLTKLTA